jgi:hypothetical protein
MKLKANIEEKIVVANKMKMKKPVEEAAYYEGIVMALHWVLGKREDIGGICGFYGENL